MTLLTPDQESRRPAAGSGPVLQMCHLVPNSHTMGGRRDQWPTWGAGREGECLPRSVSLNGAGSSWSLPFKKNARKVSQAGQKTSGGWVGSLEGGIQAEAWVGTAQSRAQESA